TEEQRNVALAEYRRVLGSGESENIFLRCCLRSNEADMVLKAATKLLEKGSGIVRDQLVDQLLALYEKSTEKDSKVQTAVRDVVVWFLSYRTLNEEARDAVQSYKNFPRNPLLFDGLHGRRIGSSFAGQKFILQVSGSALKRNVISIHESGFLLHTVEKKL